MKHLILTLSLILGLTTAASADDNLPTTTEILEEGKIIYTERYLSEKSPLFFQVDLLVVYKGMYFFCVANYKEVGCDQKKVRPSLGN